MPPDFIGIGAQKAGTTWLYQNLRPHPRVWIPWKEIHYFDRKIKLHSSPYARLFGEDRREYHWDKRDFHRSGTSLSSFPSDLVWFCKYFLRSPSDDWYLSLFEPSRGRVTGEITPSYSTLDREMVAHVHDLMPQAKIIFMMRNPIERAWSQAVMRLTNKGHAVDETSEERFRRRFDRPASRLRTDYLRTLENWGAFFPEEQIFVGFLEDVHFYPEELLEGVYGFLGVDTSFRPPISGEKVHSASANTMTARVAEHLACLYREDLLKLEKRFGGYASFWRFCAENLAEGRLKEDKVPYPLWDSAMWNEWRDSVGPRVGLQSGPLSSFRSLPRS